LFFQQSFAEYMKAVSGCQAKTKKRKTKYFSKKYIAIIEVMEKVPLFVIPANPGSDPGQAPESRTA